MQNRVKEESLIETFERKKLLLTPGETARRLYFIRSGFMRTYFIDEDGKECTTWFRGKGDLMISVTSFFAPQPAQEYIEVLQDSIVQSLTWLQLNAYYAELEKPTCSPGSSSRGITSSVQEAPSRYAPKDPNTTMTCCFNTTPKSNSRPPNKRPPPTPASAAKRSAESEEENSKCVTRHKNSKHRILKSQRKNSNSA